MRTLLAVDGGNSKTDVALVGEDGSVLATARGGGFTPQSTGVGAAVDVVHDLVRQALGPGAATPYADHMTAYLAGADLPVEEETLREEFEARGFAGDIVVSNDTFALLRAGASAPWGVAVVCGAGMNAVGVSPTGEVSRFPSLGRVSGDWGGGLGLGEEVLWHAVRGEDGRGPATALTELVRSHFGVQTVAQLVLDVHFGELDEARLAELPPGLLAAASAGDAVARSLVILQAEEVVAMAEVCMRRLDLLDTPTEVVLGGGILRARDPLLMSQLEATFATRAPHAKLIVADAPPILGSALNGLDRMGASQEARDRLRAFYSVSLT